MENQPFRTNSGRNGAESKHKRREIIVAAKAAGSPGGVRLAGIEPATLRSGGARSIP